MLFGMMQRPERTEREATVGGTEAEIASAALRLSEAARARLAERLIASLDASIEREPAEAEIGRAWDEEAERRHQAMLREDDPGVPADDVFEELRPL